ncbi:toll-like receptor 2 type-2 [Ylistrum balloti]|uniref:toll-like receptor 2 type-2 n=1 Tax=Ylistrum balloti TaxID=509963 RepID=UPI002905BAF7|nr:toll-like receptor 2 type-2 [Ylistrum balloti]
MLTLIFVIRASSGFRKILVRRFVGRGARWTLLAPGLLLFTVSDALPACCRVKSFQDRCLVTCSGCRLRDIPQDLPVNMTELNLPNNNLVRLHRYSFPKLPLLNTLNLQSNHLVRISSGAFDNTSNIQSLNLADNNLDHLSIDPKSFESLKKLNSLKIQNNYFHLKKIYPVRALSNVPQLSDLFMDIFEGFVFGEEFANLSMLNKLDLSFRGKDSVSFLNTSFLSFKQSNITELFILAYFRKIENNFLFPFRDLVSLKLVSVRSFITVREILKGLHGVRAKVMDSLVITGFRHKFTKGLNLVETDIHYLATLCVKKLKLNNNGIALISTKALTSWTSKTCIEELDVSENNFFNPQGIYILALFTSLTHLECAYLRDIPFVKRSVLTAMEMILFIPENLIYVNFTHSRIGGKLPNITVARNNNLQVLDVSYSGKIMRCSHGIIKGLVHLKELDMSGIDCSLPNPNMFVEYSNLSRLTAKQCNFGNALATNTTSLFKGLNNLSVVDISSNNLVSLSIDLFADQKDSLKYLILAKNHFNHIPSLTISHFSALERIDLSSNLISTLSKSEYSLLDDFKSKSNNFKIVLYGNPLVCSCEQLDLLSWIESTEIIYKKEELTCSTPAGSQTSIVEFMEDFDQFKDSCVSQVWLVISIILILVCFVFGVLAREAWGRSVWLRSTCRQPFENLTYKYDIFISSCSEDSSWVAKTFIPWLDSTGIEYCFEDKSFKPGYDLADNIMDAIDNSRQTVFVVSYTFLEREWSTFTLKLTSVYSFRDSREGMNIIILLNDIEKGEFPKLIRRNWHIIRPLRWPSDNNPGKALAAQEVFWEKLLKRFQSGKGHVSTSVTESIL